MCHVTTRPFILAGRTICYNCRVESINSLATHGFKSDAINWNISAKVWRGCAKDLRGRVSEKRDSKLAFCKRSPEVAKKQSYKINYLYFIAVKRRLRLPPPKCQIIQNRLPLSPRVKFRKSTSCWPADGLKMSKNNARRTVLATMRYFSSRLFFF